MKKCPFCKAEIEDNARFCLYCMKSLTEKEDIPPAKGKLPRWLLIVIGAILLSVVALIILLPKDQDTPQDKAVLSAVQTTGRQSEQTTQPDETPSGDTTASPESTFPEEKPEETTPETTEDTVPETTPDPVPTNPEPPEDTEPGTTPDPVPTNPEPSEDPEPETTPEPVPTEPEPPEDPEPETTPDPVPTEPEPSEDPEPETTPDPVPTEPEPSEDPEPETTPDPSVPETEPEDPPAESEPSIPDIPEVVYSYRTAQAGDEYNAQYVNTGNDIVITGITQQSPDGTYDIPSYIDGKKVIAITANAFYGSNAKVVYIPSTLRVIWNYAFNGCTLTDIYFTHNIYIEANAFYDVPDGLTIHCPANCQDRNFRYYKNSAANYGAAWEAWNGL